MNHHRRMNLKKTLIALAGAATAACAFAADDAAPAWYAGLHGGVNDVRHWSGNVSFSPIVTLPGQLELRRGWQAGAFAGRETAHARYELEYQHGTLKIDRLQLGPQSQSISASGHYDALTANAYRKQELADRFTAYGALGIGWGRTVLPQMAFTTPPCNCFAGASRSGFTWLARAGVEYAVASNDKAFLQYTLLALPRPGSHSTPGVEYERRNAGAVTVGWRHAF